MKKADLQVYFHDLQKRYDNTAPDPDVQRVDYQVMAHNALTVLKRLVDEGMDDEQKRLEAYHNGYDQGRFDEFADRMGKEQAKKVKGELEQQKNCPYCHSEKPLFSIMGDEIVGYIANCLDSQQFTVVYDFSPEAITDEELVNAPFGNHKCAINYCPMCGRPLCKEPER